MPHQRITQIYFFLITWIAFSSIGFSADAEYKALLRDHAPSPGSLIESLSTVGDDADFSSEVAFYENEQVRVNKSLIQNNQVGGIINYEIHIEILNPIESLLIEETIPKNYIIEETIPTAERASPLQWEFSNLEAGETQTISIFVRSDKSGIASLETNIHIEQSLPLSIFVGQPKLNLNVSAPIELELNTTGIWELSISNQGTAVAKDVEITSVISPAFKQNADTEFSLPQLDVGASRSFMFEAEALTQGNFENKFRAIYSNSNADTEPKAFTKTKVVRSGIEIETFHTQNAFVFKQEPIKINIQNVGETNLENVRITQLYPENFTIIDSAQGRARENAIGWMIPFLPAGSSQLITTLVTSTRPGNTPIETFVKTDKGLKKSLETTINWLAVPGVTLSISDSKDPITVGEITEFTIRVRNQGEFEPVSGEVLLSFTDHLKPIAILNELKGIIDNNTIRIPNIQLNPGNDVLLKVSAKAISAGSGRTNLNFMADFLNQPVINQESTNIY